MITIKTDINRIIFNNQEAFSIFADEIQIGSDFSKPFLYPNGLYILIKVCCSEFKVPIEEYSVSIKNSESKVEITINETWEKRLTAFMSIE